MDLSLPNPHALSPSVLGWPTLGKEVARDAQLQGSASHPLSFVSSLSIPEGSPRYFSSFKLCWAASSGAVSGSKNSSFVWKSQAVPLQITVGRRHCRYLFVLEE